MEGEGGASAAAALSFVPVVIRVQDLQKRLLSDEEAFAHSWNWVDSYLSQLHGDSSEMYRFLRQAMMARRVLLLLDGLDEGGKARERYASSRGGAESGAAEDHVAAVAAEGIAAPPAASGWVQRPAAQEQRAGKRPRLELALELEDGGGKNNGTIKGTAYFSCPKGAGIMARSSDVVVVVE